MANDFSEKKEGKIFSNTEDDGKKTDKPEEKNEKVDKPEENKVDENLKSMREKEQLKKHRWQRECRERERRYPVYIDMNNSINGKYIVNEMVCEFCTHTVYIDPHHVNRNHIGVPHDRYVGENDKDTVVKHHFTHCRGFWGTDEDKEKCRKLREMKGMPDPFYKTNPKKLLEDLRKKKEKGTLKPEEEEIMKTMEKKEEDKKIVSSDKIATLDEVIKIEEDKVKKEVEWRKPTESRGKTSSELLREQGVFLGEETVTTVPNRFKHIIEIEADTYTIPPSVIDELLECYSIDQLRLVTQENKTK